MKTALEGFSPNTPAATRNASGTLRLNNSTFNRLTEVGPGSKCVGHKSKRPSSCCRIAPLIGFWPFIVVSFSNKVRNVFKRTLGPEQTPIRTGQRRIGSNSGGTSTSMLRATPGRRRTSFARSRVSTIWWTEGGLTPKCRCMSASAGGRPSTRV
jgi:hypothetical protein